MTLDGYRLMIPGPIQLAPDVLAELARPVVPHYGADWTEFYNETIDLLRRTFRTDGMVYAIPGSGSAGLEAALGSSLGRDDRLLVLSNGFFGERVAAIAQSLHEHTDVVRLPIDRPIEPEDLRRALESGTEYSLVAAVHSESSSGLLNPVRALADVCRENGTLFFVDAISSLGGIELSMDAWGIDLCVSASQKCLEGPPGLALVAVGQRAWERISHKRTRGWYLNLHVWQDYAENWSDWHPYPITMAVPALRALRRGLERIFAEGLERRIERHRSMASSTRKRLGELGFHPVFPEAQASPTILAICGRDDVPADEVVDRLRAEHKILIARGMGEFRGKAFRIGNMGPQAEEEQMNPLIDAIRAIAGDQTGERQDQ
jgi:alanine-glyoxylate transaminase/serine-glyoxylate transaminase/serine-pyruvate transaminase